jgi:hypothetical protein
MNAYSYSVDNPIAYKDPSGKCVEDACVIETSPLWAPVLIAGAGTLAASVETSLLLRDRSDSPRGPFNPNTLTASMGMPDPVDGVPPPDWNPKTPNWLKWAAVGATLAGVAKDYYNDFKDAQNTGTTFVKGSKPRQATPPVIQSSLPSIWSGSPTYRNPNSTNNRAVGAPSYATRNYVTSNGAVINWYAK